MIEALHLKNFQGHESTLLEFTPGINAITGKSDNGKSSIVRALNYARYNRPASNNYPSHWIKNDKGNLTGEMQIAIKKGSESIIRYRNKDENGYKVNGETLKAINRDVPEQVESILNLSEVNIQKQLDSHFLLSDTPGQIAGFFNSLVKLDEIDDYLSEADSLKRKNNKEIKELTENVKALEIQLKTYDWIERAEKLNKSLSVVETDLSGLESSINDTGASLRVYRDTVQALSGLPDFEAVQSIITAIETLKEPDYKGYDRLETAYMNHHSILAGIGILPDIDKAGKLIAEISAIPEPDYEALEDQLENVERMHGLVKWLSELKGIETAGDLIGKIEKYNSRIADYYSDFQRLGRDVASYSQLVSDCDYVLEMLAEIENKMPDACPLCGGALAVGVTCHA